jgi:hypothetical protein
MKKVLTVIFLLVVLTSCDDSFKSHQLTEGALVDLEFADSTQWHNAKIHVSKSDDRYLYIKQDETVYKMYGAAPYQYLLPALIGLCLGMLIGINIGEKSK